MRRGTMRHSPSNRGRPLHLPTPGLSARDLPPSGPRVKRRRPVSPLQQLAIGVLCVVGAGLILKGLMSLANRLNTLLLVSQAVANLIRGLSLLAVGLLQVLALLVVAALALLALLLLVGGLTRLLRLLAAVMAGGGASRPVRGQGDPDRGARAGALPDR
jgi:hypothetical protein